MLNFNLKYFLQEKQEIVCLRHFPKMDVEPGSLILRYRYTLDELATLLQGLKVRAESYDSWTSKVRAALEAKGEERLEFSELKKMLTEAQGNKYPESELLEALQLTVEEAAGILGASTELEVDASGERLRRRAPLAPQVGASLLLGGATLEARKASLLDALGA